MKPSSTYKRSGMHFKAPLTPPIDTFLMSRAKEKKKLSAFFIPIQFYIAKRITMFCIEMMQGTTGVKQKSVLERRLLSRVMDWVMNCSS